MTAQDTENQAGGAEPVEDNPNAPAAAEHSGKPESDNINPHEQLKADALAFIIAARRLCLIPSQILEQVEEEIADR